MSVHFGRLIGSCLCVFAAAAALTPASAQVTLHLTTAQGSECTVTTDAQGLTLMQGSTDLKATGVTFSGAACSGTLALLRVPADRADQCEAECDFEQGRDARRWYHPCGDHAMAEVEQAEDADRGRLYLPKELLEQHGIPCSAPRTVLQHPKLKKVCRDVAILALDHFTKARAAMDRCAKRPMRPAAIMGAVYRAILQRLVKADWRHLDQPVKLPKWQKLWLAFRYGFL